MPQAIPIIVAVAAKAAGWSALTTAIAGMVASFLVSALTAKKPKTPSGDFGFRASSQGRTQTVRQAISSHRVIYGEVRTGGSLTFLESGGSSNEYLHMVVTLGSAGPYEAIDSVWINDVEVQLTGSPTEVDANGNVIHGKFANLVRIKTHLGAHDQMADADLVADTQVDSNFKMGGICYVYVRLKWDRNKFNGIPNISAKVKGRKVWDSRGSPEQDPNDPDTWTWSDNAALCLLDYVRGAPSKIGDSTIQRRMGLNALDTAIDTTAFSSAADVCDEAVTLAGSPTETEARYTANGVVETNRRPYEVINDMTSAMAGEIVYTSGTWSPVVGEYTAPTITLDEDDLRESPIIQPKVSRRDLFNAVKGVFISPDHAWQPTDYPPVTNASYESEDNGRRIWADFDTPFTTSSATAQRLAKLNLEGHRRQVTVKLACKLTAFQVKAGDTISLTLDRMGWTAKPFYVTSWSLADGAAQDGTPYYGVDLTLKEIDSSVFTWDAEETAITVQPSPTLPDPFAVAAPTGLTITSGTDELFLRQDGTVFSRMKVSWTAPADEFVTSGGHIEIQYKRSTDSSWDKWATVPGSETFVHILDVEDGTSYDIAVRSANNLGVYSDTDQDPANWSAYTTHTVVGKTEAPSDVDTFNVSRLPDGTRRFTWTHASVPVDVKTGGGYQIKYVSGLGGTWATMSNLHGGLWLVSPYETNELAAGTYTFGIKAVDSTGNESANATIIEATLGDPRLRNVLTAQNEFDDGWPGTKTNCFVNVEGFLEGVGSTGSPQGDWSSLPDTWSAMADTWLEVVENETTMTYVTPEIDLGVETTINPILSTSGVGTITTEMQIGTEADGSAEGSPDDDNTWQTVGLATSTRYIRFRITVTGTAGSGIILYSAYSLIDAEIQVEDYEDIDTSSSTVAEFESIATGHFRLRTRGNTAQIASAQITSFQNAGSGWSSELISKSTTLSGSPNDDFPAAEWKIYKDGVLTDATIDATIRGTKS